MKKLLVVITILLVSLLEISAQESNNGKRLWANSYLNKQAPELVVKKWLSKRPKLKGKFVLIDFWSTKCPPCRKLIPELNRFAKKFKKHLVVIGVAEVTEEEMKAAKDLDVQYYSAIDPDKIMRNKLAIKGIPHVILIDPRGIVRWEGFPLLQDHKLTEEVIARLIEKYK